MLYICVESIKPMEAFELLGLFVCYTMYVQPVKSLKVKLKVRAVSVSPKKLR